MCVYICKCKCICVCICICMCISICVYVYIYIYICILIYITHSLTHLCMSMYLPSHSLTSLTKICTCMFICILQCIYNCHYTPHSTNTLLYTYEVLPCTHRDALPFLQVKPAMLNMSTNDKNICNHLCALHTWHHVKLMGAVNQPA